MQECFQTMGKGLLSNQTTENLLKHHWLILAWKSLLYNGSIVNSEPRTVDCYDLHVFKVKQINSS